ncbi:MAG: mechanosensitive ion channel domain-containing protein, partial [Myxococcota bacterium]
PSSLLEFLNPSAIPSAIAVVVLAVLVVRGSTRVLRKLSDRFTRQRLLIGQTTAIVAFLVYSAAGLTAFGMVFNLSPEALLAVSGTVAVTLGFAFKDVAASFLAGISILTNKPFQVGDRISFGGYYGEVKEIGLRTVRLVTLDDNLVTIPSNKFLTDPVASANAGELDCMVVMNFFVDAGADHARAQEIVRQAVLASKYLYLGKPLAVLLSNRVSEHGRLIVELTAKAYVYDTRHEKAFASDVTDRVLRAFKRDGVALPGFLPTPS